jgi:putative hydrolase of the HAD superfamily
MIRGLIFDLGGVVVEWSNSTTYRYIEERYGIPEADFRRVAEEGMPAVQVADITEAEWMANTFKRFGLDHPDGYADVWGSTFEAARYDPQMVSLVKGLRSRGYRVAALSNVEASRARWLRAHDIGAIFDDVVLSCEVGLRKPDLSPGTSDDLKIFGLATKALKLKAGECLFVDDNVNCVEAGKLAGLDSVLFRGHKELLVELGARGILPEP